MRSLAQRLFAASTLLSSVALAGEVPPQPAANASSLIHSSLLEEPSRLLTDRSVENELARAGFSELDLTEEHLRKELGKSIISLMGAARKPRRVVGS